MQHAFRLNGIVILGLVHMKAAEPKAAVPPDMWPATMESVKLSPLRSHRAIHNSNVIFDESLYLLSRVVLDSTFVILLASLPLSRV